LDHSSEIILEHTIQNEDITEREANQTLIISGSSEIEEEDNGSNGDQSVGKINGNTQELIVGSEGNTSFKILIHQFREAFLELVGLAIRSDADESSKSGREQTVDGTSGSEFINLGLLDTFLAESGDKPDNDASNEDRAESFGVNDSNGDHHGKESETNTQDIFLRERKSLIEDTNIIGESVEDSTDRVTIEELRRVFDDSINHFIMEILGSSEDNIVIKDTLEHISDKDDTRKDSNNHIWLFQGSFGPEPNITSEN